MCPAQVLQQTQEQSAQYTHQKEKSWAPLQVPFVSPKKVERRRKSRWTDQCFPGRSSRNGKQRACPVFPFWHHIPRLHTYRRFSPAHRYCTGRNRRWSHRRYFHLCNQSSEHRSRPNPHPILTWLCRNVRDQAPKAGNWWHFLLADQSHRRMHKTLLLHNPTVPVHNTRRLPVYC